MCIIKLRLTDILQGEREGGREKEIERNLSVVG